MLQGSKAADVALVLATAKKRDEFGGHAKVCKGRLGANVGSECEQEDLLCKLHHTCIYIYIYIYFT